MSEGMQLLVEPARDKNGKPLFAAADVPAGWKLEVAEERQDGTIVALVSGSDTPAFASLVEAWGRDERDENGKAVRGTGSVGKVESVARAARTDRMGEALAAIDLSTDDSHVVDVELRAGSTDQDGPARRGEFRQYVAQVGGRLIDGEINAADYYLFRAELPSWAIIDLVNYRFDLLFIDLPPRVELEMFDLTRPVDEAPFPEIMPRRLGTPVIGLIDGGVVDAHPLLRSSLATLPHQSWVPGNAAVNAPATDARHGCAAAGIAALGSLREALVRQSEPITPLGVCVARVLDHSEQLPETLNLPARLSEIIEHLQSQAGVRIVNHSIASKSPFRTSRMSVWAERLDHIAREKQILFVVPSGNVDGEVNPRRDWLDVHVSEGRYPLYLLEDRCRLRDPAQALNVLTVGGYVPEAAAPWRARTQQGLEPIAQSGQVSPLSRTGPGYARTIKPDVVEESGNYYRDASGALNITSRITDVAVVDPSWLTAGQQVRFTHGTSVAAPKVAHLAGRILEALPGAGPDLLRALIVNGAEWPQPVRRSDREDALRQFGYGVPRAPRIFDISGSRSMILIEDSIRIGRVQYFVIPFPREIFVEPTSTLVRVSITLAYRPPVRRTNKRYRGTVLEWSMVRRGESLDGFRRRFANLVDVEEAMEDQTEDDTSVKSSASPEVASIDEPEPVGDWEWIVGRNARTRGTVQKDWFEAPVAYLGDEIVLAVAGRRGWMNAAEAATFTQRYAAVLSIEAIGSVVPLHETIKARVQSRVPIAAR